MLVSGIGVVNIANVLIVFRFLLVLVFVVFMFVGGGYDVVWWYVATVVFVFVSFTDWIDGELVCCCGLIIDFGKLLDSIVDKVFVGAVLISLLVLGDLFWWVMVVMLGCELGVIGLWLWVICCGVILVS